MKKAIYAISGFVPSDEKIVSMNLYKLIKIGSSNPIYGWINAIGDEKSGIGTCTDNFGTLDKDEAILSINGYLDEKAVVMKCTFTDAMQKYYQFRDELELENKEYLTN